ncbi:hypothetical protein CDD81_152 [Ophiocordyceps australis]|uniref:Cytochrome P450 n=1 Tax=Ophiocordyceps australis TaxID=1399860 RepID=A0A2C5YID1_9HYPO|nr:hypothetical protein CDD81_152 [Ophiocordyceps australis]
MAWPTVLSTAGASLLIVLSYYANVAYHHRRKINELRKQGIPMPKEWNWFTGHLMVLQKYLDKGPQDAAVALAMRELAREYADTEVFLMDFWPVYPALLVLFGPKAITQVSNEYNLPKTAVVARFMKPVSGGPDLVSMNGDEWKYWRSLFNPGFSSGAMLNSVPHIVDSTLVFREKLVEMIGRGMFSLDELTTKLTTEVILKVTLDDDSNYQRSPNALVTALRRICRWHSFWDPRVLMNPLRPFVQRYNGYIVNAYIRRELEQRFQEVKQEQQQNGLEGKSTSTKSVISLALEAYLASKQDTGRAQQDKLDDGFVEYATWQIRVFLFAGTDTTASTMVYVFYMLFKHPDWLYKLRCEHDDIFGKDPANAAGLLKQEPALLNRCKLTLAVIKETLRLYVPAGTVREGAPGVSVTDLKGNEQPMEYCGANVLHQALHVNPRVWPRPDEFLPERFLVGPEHELYPDPAAYRPFEQGPRNCIGQTLVWNELKIAVILVCRELEIREAYADFDAQREAERGLLDRLKIGVFGQPIKTAYGERAYQTDTGGLHPANGFPCYVSWAKGYEQ